MKSVSSSPICPPAPAPQTIIAEGADQFPFGSLAITSPLPSLPEKINPPF